MANNIYNVNSLGSATGAVTITDDGTGIDWLTITGSFPTYTSINLEYTYAQDGTATSAWGRFDTAGPPATTTLRINGIIENVRGSDTTDFIGGNHANNLIYGDAASTGVGGSDTINGDYGDDTIYGGSGADNLLGAGDNDLLFGNAGADSINGNGGVDVINGGLGSDSLSGGGQSRDRVTYSDSNAGVKVLINFGTTTTATGGHAQGDQINGFTDVTGSDFRDVITDAVAGTVAFGYNANRFYGGDGKDTLTLGGGKDRGYGGAGDDVVDGGIGRDDCHGDDGADRLYGGQDNDSLSGGAGKDRIIGDAGLDHLEGGKGADTFIYRSWVDSAATKAGRDIIADFKQSEGDMIDLGKLDPAGAPTAITFLGSAGFNGVSGAMRITVSDGNTLVTIDRDGDRDADFSLKVLGVINLIEGDFLL